VAAAELGAAVLGVDWDPKRLAQARDRAASKGLSIEWRVIDLESEWPDLGSFDAVLVFNYLDRASMPRLLRLVSPGGLLIMETFLVLQRKAGWGPTSDKHLLQPGELARLVAPLTVLHGREALEIVDADRWRAVASIVARNSKR
jgi:2-polyprenyl-3-methyl-5-hydroxy-6-metoxy-1,4-benzoquinol methylase